jgi:hypothetical protein
MKTWRLDDLNGWLEEEAATIPEDAFRTTIIAVNAQGAGRSNRPAPTIP